VPSKLTLPAGEFASELRKYEYHIFRNKLCSIGNIFVII